ncbi:hypothetical protein HN803_02290 [candidate division WWE3 bacterium]|jgi:hypothetical protein|nr:hypothetical protein [candidate division WWE3 bacterium]
MGTQVELLTNRTKKVEVPGVGICAAHTIKWFCCIRSWDSWEKNIDPYRYTTDSHKINTIRERGRRRVENAADAARDATYVLDGDRIIKPQESWDGIAYDTEHVPGELVGFHSPEYKAGALIQNFLLSRGLEDEARDPRITHLFIPGKKWISTEDFMGGPHLGLCLEKSNIKEVIDRGVTKLRINGFDFEKENFRLRNPKKLLTG